MRLVEWLKAHEDAEARILHVRRPSGTTWGVVLSHNVVSGTVRLYGHGRTLLEAFYDATQGGPKPAQVAEAQQPSQEKVGGGDRWI